jgi:hypothetical protein
MSIEIFMAARHQIAPLKCPRIPRRKFQPARWAEILLTPPRMRLVGKEIESEANITCIPRMRQHAMHKIVIHGVECSGKHHPVKPIF